MIIGRIQNGIKSILFFKLKNTQERELSEIQNILLVRLSTVPEQAKKNMVKSIKEIDRILNPKKKPDQIDGPKKN